jgi:hypothetical protein
MTEQLVLFDAHLHDEVEQLRARVVAAEAALDEAERENHHLTADKAALTQRVRDLEIRMHLWQARADMQELLRVLERGHVPQVREMHAALTRLAAQVHPDRWQGSPVAEECTKLVLALRDRFAIISP